jgi:hypothetical protein
MNFTTASFDEDRPARTAVAVVVGLTRIELVTSSLSGMRSNRLSYSPITGLRTLSVGLARLNRPSHHFFFQNGDPDTPHQFGDEVENDGSEHPQSRSEGNAENPENGERPEEFCALEGEGVPAEGLEELLHVVDGARGTTHIP